MRAVIYARRGDLTKFSISFMPVLASDEKENGMTIVCAVRAPLQVDRGKNFNFGR